MTEERITLTLIASTDEPSSRTNEYQASLREVERTLRALDSNVSVLASFQESVDASMFLKGGFTIAKSVVAAAVPAIGAWLLGRAGRKVRLKVGDVEAEAHSVSEIQELLKVAGKLQPQEPPATSVGNSQPTETRKRMPADVQAKLKARQWKK